MSDFIEHIFIDTVDKLDNLCDMYMGVPLMWKVRNDFDEMEDAEIHGCLACGQSATSSSGGRAHCCKDKCRDKHVAELKKMRTMIMRKQKAAENRKFKNDYRNWDDQKLVDHIKLHMRHYKWQLPYVKQLVAEYNDYVSTSLLASAVLTVIPDVALVMNAGDLRAEYMRWWACGDELDEHILRMREVLWHKSSFDYDRWKVKSSISPDAVWIPTRCYDHESFEPLFPQL